jgi:uncharacterized protein YecT (DUF1311 family)
MRFAVQLALTALCLTSASPSLAGCDQCSKEFGACISGAQGITSEIQACQSREEEIQEARLNASYQRALKRLSPERRKELRDVQRRWLAYRDAAMRFYVETGHSAHKVSSSDHLLQLTAERVRELDEINY